MNASEIAGDVVSVVMVLMILTVLGIGWWWLVLWLLAQTVKMLHHVQHGAPDYKYLARMEHALFAHNLTAAMEEDARQRAEHFH